MYNIYIDLHEEGEWEKRLNVHFQFLWMKAEENESHKHVASFPLNCELLMSTRSLNFYIAAHFTENFGENYWIFISWISLKKNWDRRN